MIAGTLELQLMADVARIKADMDKAVGIVKQGARGMEDAAERVRSALAGMVSGLSVAAFGAWIKAAIDAADAINDLSKSTSIAVGQLAGLKLAAMQSGGDLSSVAQSVNKLQLEIGRNAEKFKAIGITAKDGLGAFKQLSDVFKGIEDPQLRAAVAAEALGKSWAGAAPLLSEGSEKIQAMVDKGEALYGITQDLADQADEFNDRMAELRAEMDGYANRIATGVLPVLIAMLKGWNDNTTAMQGASGGFSAITETLKAIIVLGGNVSFVLQGIGNDFGGIAAQVAAVMRGDFKQAAEMGRMMKEDAAKNRAAFDAWEQSILKVGTTAKVAAEAVAKVGLTPEQRKALEGFAVSGLEAARTQYEKIVKSIKDRIDAQQEEKRLGRELTEEERFAMKVRSEFAEVLKKIPGLSRKVVDGLLAEAAVTAEVNALRVRATSAAEAEAKATNDLAEEVDALNKARGDSWAAFVRQEYEQRQTIADSNEQLELEARLLGATDRERQTAIETLRIEQKLRKDIEALKARGLDAAFTDKGIADLIRNAETEKAQAGTRAALTEQIDILNQIESTAHSVWTNVWEGGSDVFKRLGKTIKATVLDLLYQMTMKKWVLSIGASVFGGAAAAGQAANAGGVGLLGSLGSSAVGSTMLGGASMFGQAAGATMQNGMFSGFGANMANISTLAEGGSMMGSIGAAAPYVALALAAVALISKLMEGGGPKSDGYSGPLFSSITDTARATGSNPLGGTAKSMVDAITAQYNAIAGLFGKSGSAQFGVGYTVDPQGDAPTFLEVAASRNGQQVFSAADWNVGREDADLQKAFAEAIPAAIFAALKTSDLEKPFQDFFDTIADDASSEVKAAALQTVQDVQRLTVAIDRMGGVFSGFSALSVTARADLIALSGGMEAMGASLAAMNDALFTDADKNTATLKSIAEVFEGLGLSLPHTNAGFLALVNAQDLTTEAGRQTAAALVGVAGAFGQVTTAIQGATRTALQEIAASLKTMRDRAAAASQGVADARANIFDAYSEAQGRLNSLLEQSRQATIAFGQTLRQYLASLSLGQFATETPAGQYEALQRRLFETAALAKGGNAGARDGLTSAADAFLQSAQDRSTSAVDFAMDRAKVRTLLDEVLASLPAGAQPGAQKTLEQQITDAQKDVADYFKLATDTGVNVETATLTVADNILALKEAYDAASAEKTAADAALKVALEALKTLDLSEETINALLSGATGNSPGDFATALGVGDDTILAIQAAMGLTDAELEELSEALNVTVAPTVFEALAGSLGITTELAEDLAWGLGVSPIQMTALSGSLGLSTDAAEMLGRVLTLTPQQRYDLSVALGVEPGQMLALGTALGIDPWLSEHLGYVLGLSGAAQGIIDSLPEAIGIPAGLLPALGSSLGLSPSALAALATITGTTPFTTAPLTDWYAPANGPTIDFGAAGQDLGAFPVQAYMADNSDVVNAVQNMSASLTTQLRKIEQNTEGTNNTLNGIRNGDITVTTEAA